MSAWLKIDGIETKYPLPAPGNFCIGRNQSCDLCLADPKASRNHAIIQNTGDGEYLLIDIASRNGCFVNEKRISSPSLLKNGDHIRVGDTRFEFLKTDEVPADNVMEQTLMIERRPGDLNIQDITILVADIRDFTSLTETVGIEVIADIMNLWFELASDCVELNQGMVDKFIGDCVYARWTSDQKPDNSAFQALRTAQALNKISLELNEKHPDLPFPLKIGVGINTGRAAVDIGRDNTAMGDAVNLAFRLEGLCKTLGKQIVISKNTCDLLTGHPWEKLQQTVSVKGKSEEVDIVAVDFNELEDFLSQTR